MAYIGKVTLTDSWEKLEDLIKALDGQSTFAFDTTKQYAIQVDTILSNCNYSGRFCNSATEPANPDDGEHYDSSMAPFVYEPASGIDLYVKKATKVGTVKVSVSEI